jgi:hypothetical protein
MAAFYARDRLAPAPDQAPAIFVAHLRAKDLIRLPQRGNLVRRTPESDAESRKRGDQVAPWVSATLSASLEFFAYAGGTPALPDHGVVRGREALAVPAHGGFPLAGVVPWSMAMVSFSKDRPTRSGQPESVAISLTREWICRYRKWRF